jgi:DNA helicase-2/ATP-dependent DNA helicase PcrA
VARWSAALVAQRPPGPEPSLTEYPDDQAEANAVAARVSSLIGQGVAAREIAVLVRINAQTQAVERALREAGVPYQVRGAERFFDRAEVRQAIGLLRAAAKSWSPAGEPGEPAAGTGGAARLPAEVRHVLTGLGLTDSAPPSRGGAVRERWESLAALLGLADDLSQAHPGATLADFAAELAERAAAEHPPVAPGVTLSSLHAAKGLEWDVVFLPGLAEGVLPIVYAQTPEAIGEERRLLYVGVTRARQRVELSWAAARSPGGRQARKPSRFLASLRLGGLSPEPQGTVGPLRKGGVGPVRKGTVSPR